MNLQKFKRYTASSLARYAGQWLSASHHNTSTGSALGVLGGEPAGG